MGFLGIIFGSIAALVAIMTGQSLIGALAIAAAAGAFAADRICYKYAIATARLRADYDGKFIEADLENVPGGWTGVTFMMIGTCLVLAAVAIFGAIQS